MHTRGKRASMKEALDVYVLYIVHTRIGTSTYRYHILIPKTHDRHARKENERDQARECAARNRKHSDIISLHV